MARQVTGGLAVDDLLPGDGGGDRRVEAAAATFREGGGVVILSDAGRGFLAFPSSEVVARSLVFLSSRARGLIAAALPLGRVRDLGIVPRTGAPAGEGLTVSSTVRARSSANDGSAVDRAATIRLLADAETSSAVIEQPGDVFLAAVAEHGVLANAGAAEAAVDLARIAGLPAAAVLAEVLSREGQPADVPQLREFARQASLPVLRVREVVNYRLARESLLACAEEVNLPVAEAVFRAHALRSVVDGVDLMALVLGRVDSEEGVPVYVQEPCAGAVFRSSLCGCREALEQAICQIAEAAHGVVLYLEGSNRLAHASAGDARRMDAHVVQALRLLGVRRVRWVAGSALPSGPMSGR